MARRRALKDLTTPDPTPDKQLQHPSGWCMTLTHEFCPYQFRHGKCGCDCHTKPKSVPKRTRAVADDKTQKTQSPRKKTASIGDKDYVDPRPWKR